MDKIDKDFYISVVLRFLRIFISAGLAQVVLILYTNPFPGFAPEVLKNWMWILLTAFLSGGFAAIDKAIRYKE